MIPHYPQRAPIEAFGRNGFRFAHLSHRGSLLVLPSGMYSWSTVAAAELAAGDFAQLFAERSALDWVLIGTGDTMQKPPAPVVAAFSSHGIPFDYMSTASAVRTYNVVLAEGRRVAAAFIAVQDSHA